MSKAMVSVEKLLEWTTEFWLTVQKTLNKLSQNPIVAIEPVDEPNDLNLDRAWDDHVDMDPTEFYEIVYGNDDLTTPLDEAGVEQRVWEGALTYRTCSKAAYILRPILTKILASTYDQPVPVQWRRKVVKKPDLIFIPSARDPKVKIPVMAHDYLILEFNEESFVVDVARQQFGLKDWLYTKNTYNELLTGDIYLPPLSSNPDKELEEEDRRLPLLRAAVENVVDSVVEEWKSQDITWGNILQLKDEEREKLYSDLVKKARERVGPEFLNALANLST
ncbi:hypothetical protein BDV95DRAFT_601719 [Massariosphaeria phaeospora]|uniref:Uncharacterized protein n=1 Tax=Massariosphaeria phaeospora TaxID=100035 RepID=A0A7C8IE21_9PLEO|nr:hypothetical protein BDV95DRAFT_601719 [Massariosphaeria phaeospora]